MQKVFALWFVVYNLNHHQIGWNLKKINEILWKLRCFLFYKGQVFSQTWPLSMSDYRSLTLDRLPPCSSSWSRWCTLSAVVRTSTSGEPSRVRHQGPELQHHIISESVPAGPGSPCNFVFAGGKTLSSHWTQVGILSSLKARLQPSKLPRTSSRSLSRWSFGFLVIVLS